MTQQKTLIKLVYQGFSMFYYSLVIVIYHYLLSNTKLAKYVLQQIIRRHLPCDLPQIM